MKKYILISLAVLITCTLAIAHTAVSEDNPKCYISLLSASLYF